MKTAFSINFILFGIICVLGWYSVPTVAQTTTQPATQPGAQRGGRGGPPRWVDPHPEIPYLAKPATRPADWLMPHDPVNPNATPEARALLKYL